MKRRDALHSLTALTAGSIILPQFLMGCEKGPYEYELFNWGDTEWFNAFGEFIIPATPGIPGAAAANVGDFVQRYVTDCFKTDHRSAFLDGLASFRLQIEETYGKHFLDLDKDLKSELFNRLENESSSYNIQRLPGDPPHFYTMLKNTVMYGYFTSEIGSTKALNYLPVPGEQGIIPYEGQKAWAL